VRQAKLFLSFYFVDFARSISTFLRFFKKHKFLSEISVILTFKLFLEKRKFERSH
jgi:hypothetical protein